MKTYLPIFIIALLLAWAFLWWFGDYKMYVDVGDGRMWVKDKGTATDRALFSFVLALIFAAFETGILWLWNKLRG
jgi:hypothetical protein